MPTPSCAKCGASLTDDQISLCPKCSKGGRDTDASVGDEAPTVAGIPTPIDPDHTPFTPSNTLSENTRRFFSGVDLSEGLVHRRSSYRKLEDLGEWEFGTIQLAEHSQLKRRVRLVVLESPWAADPAIQEWFLSTSRVLASLQHHRVECTVLEVVDEGGTAVALSERDLDDIHNLVRFAEVLHPDTDCDPVARALLDAIQGLEAIHRAGLVMGRVGIQHMAWSDGSLRLVLRPFQKGIPGASLLNGENKQLSITDEVRSDDFRQLAQAFIEVLDGPRNSNQSTWRWRRTCRRLPLLRPSIAKCIARLNRKGIAANQLAGMQSSLAILAAQRSKAIGILLRLRAAVVDLILLSIGTSILAIGWLIVEAIFNYQPSSSLTSSVFLCWLLIYIVGFETIWNSRPGLALLGVHLLDTQGKAPLPSRRLTRTLVRLAFISLFTIPAILGVRFADGNQLFALAFDEQDSLLLFAMGCTASLLLYATAWGLRGVPLHDWLSGIRMFRFVYDGEEHVRISPLERIKSPPTPAIQALTGTPGASIGPYQLGEEIGRGGMGTVYRGLDSTLGRPVAIKVISSAVQDGEVIARFQREAQLAANLDHPHIAKVYSVGLWDNQPYMAMEFVEGKNLHQVVSENGSLSVPRAWDIIQQAAAGLQEASQQGIVHRDIKPSNLMITPLGIVKVMDFGISKLQGEEFDSRESRPLIELDTHPDTSLTRTGALMGTPQFMSPEQTRGEVLDARSDIYSLGLTLYFLLSGKSPYEGSQLYELIIKQCTEKLPPLPDRLLNAEQQRVLDRMLAKSSDERYQDYESLIEDLNRTFPALAYPASANIRVASTLLDLLAMLLLKRGLEGFAPVNWAPHFSVLGALLAFGSVLLFTRRFSATPGMWLLSLRFESQEGKPLTWKVDLLRFACKWPLWIVMCLESLLQVFWISKNPFVMGAANAVTMIAGWGIWIASYFLLQHNRQVSLLDMIAKTRVIKIPTR